MPERVAFIGLGIMGGPMAGHLLASGAQLIGLDAQTRIGHSDCSIAGQVGRDQAEAAAEADVVFTCVPDTPDVEAVVLE